MEPGDLEYQQKLLHVHQDLLILERRMHRWITEATGLEVIDT